MVDSANAQRDLSARRIIGFACNQAFLFYSLFIGVRADADGLRDSGLGQNSLLLTMLFMVVGFALIRAVKPSYLPRLFSRPLLYLYAIVEAAGALLLLLFPTGQLWAIALQGLLVGLPAALLLTAWGRAFDREATTVSVPEVFLGSLAAAVVFLVFSLAGWSMVALGAVCLLPLASVVNIEVRTSGVEQDKLPPSRQDGEARALSIKILAGTVLFGMAAGLVLLYRGVEGEQWVMGYRVAFVLFGAFLIGGLTLLLSDGFGRGAALNKSYRLAVFVMMVGVLLVPWPLLENSIMPGEAVVLAGYLGLESVLISLFLVLAEVTEADCASAFSAGFASLFAGELVGALVARYVPQAFSDPGMSYLTIILAGAITLVAYVFLFTERDFDDLSQLVTAQDAIEVACERIIEQYGLSNRESEILAFALRGRTNERIAQELVIAKSTVDTHLRRIYNKCGVHSRQELLDLAERLSP